MRLSFLTILLFLTLPGYSQWAGMEIQQIIPKNDRSYSMAIAKTNVDEFPDLLVLGTENFTRLQVYSGGEESHFSFTGNLLKDENYRVLGTGDINADGVDDLIISGYWSNGFKLFWGNGDGTFTEGQHYGLTGHGKNVKTVDLNNDGALDLVALSGGSGQPITLHVYHGNKTQTLVQKGVYSSVLHTDRNITILDKNQDGLKDILVVSSFPWFVIFYQQSDGSFVPRYWPQQLQDPFTSHYFIADLDNDSKEDIIAYYYNEGFRFYKGLPDTLFSEHFIAQASLLNPYRIYTKDINGDGFIDMVMDHYDFTTDETTSALYFFLGKGDFTFEDPITINFPGGVEYFIVEDVNQDSMPDVIASCKDVGIVVAINSERVTGIEDDVVLFDVYPNPFREYVSIQTIQTEPISVYTNFGQLVYESTSNMNNEHTINTTTWSAGIYIVKGGSHVRKLIKY